MVTRDFMTAIINRPNHDDATKYASAWFQKVIDFMKPRGFTITDAAGVYACRTRWLEERLKNQIYQTGVGHGNATTFAGMYNEVLMKADRDEYLMESRVVFLLSCSTAKILGLQLISRGKALAYIGYFEDFTFMASKGPGSDPDTDEYQKPFHKSTAEISFQLAQGKKPSEANAESIKMWNFYIAQAPEGSSLKKWEIWDRDAQRLYLLDGGDVPITGPVSGIEKVEFYYTGVSGPILIGQGVQEGDVWKISWDTKTVPDGDYLLLVKAYPRSPEWQPSNYVERRVKVDNSTLPKAKAEWVTPEEGETLHGKVELKAKASAE